MPASRVATSAVSLLNRLRQGPGRASRRPQLLESLRVVDGPDFTFTKSGTDHEPIHHATCTLQCQVKSDSARWVDRIVRASGAGPTRSAARELAAQGTVRAAERAAAGLASAQARCDSGRDKESDKCSGGDVRGNDNMQANDLSGYKVTLSLRHRSIHTIPHEHVSIGM
eukprot:scaffold110050_cov34-Prasinocladus_malaysianus.AAC.1